MTLAQIASGESVFVDANIFLLHFGPDPKHGPACSNLMMRIENQDLVGYTSVIVVNEVAHRLMTIEARKRFQWSAGKTVQRLKQHPQHFAALTFFRTAMEAILQSRIQVLGNPPQLLLPAADISQRHGLLISDAFSVALMQSHGFTHVASADADLDRVPGIVRYGPG